MTPVRDSDEELFELKELYQRLQVENQTLRKELEGFHRELTEKQRLIDRHDNEIHKKDETAAQLKQEVRRRFRFVSLDRSFVRPFVPSV